MVYEQSVFKMGYSHPGKRKGQGVKQKTLTKTACFGGGCSEMCLVCSRCQTPLCLLSNGPCFSKWSPCMGTEKDKYVTSWDFSWGIRIRR